MANAGDTPSPNNALLMGGYVLAIVLGAGLGLLVIAAVGAAVITCIEKLRKEVRLRKLHRNEQRREQERVAYSAARRTAADDPRNDEGHIYEMIT
jgi:hypothetical protein